MPQKTKSYKLSLRFISAILVSTFLITQNDIQLAFAFAPGALPLATPQSDILKKSDAQSGRRHFMQDFNKD